MRPSCIFCLVISPTYNITTAERPQKSQCRAYRFHALPKPSSAVGLRQPVPSLCPSVQISVAARSGLLQTTGSLLREQRHSRLVEPGMGSMFCRGHSAAAASYASVRWISGVNTLLALALGTCTALTSLGMLEIRWGEEGADWELN